MFNDFFNYINTFDIVILIETHLIEEKIEQFKKYFKNLTTFWKPAYKVSNYGRAIGGCMFGINKNLNSTEIKCNFLHQNGMDIIKVMINRTEILIFPLYIRGAEWDSDFGMVEKHFLEFSPTNAIIIGDLNARIGYIQQEIDEEYLSAFYAYTGQRKSEDSENNTMGKKVMDFCGDYGLTVLNGATKGDELGKCTFVGGRGDSVIDICAASQDLLGCVDSFNVDEKIWSDHMPIFLKLKIRVQTEKIKTILLPKLQWKDHFKSQYNQNVLNELSSLKEQKDKLDLADIVDVIHKSTNKNNKKQEIFAANNKWFDWKCYEARKLSFEMLKNYRQDMNLETKRKYLMANEKFKAICKNKKVEYYKDLDIKINQVTDSKSWWKIANEIRNKNHQELSNISSSDFKTYFMTLLNPIQTASDIHYAPPYQTDDCLDKSISSAEIYEVLAKAKTNKAPGEDRIPYEFFKNSPRELINELTNIYNRLYNNMSLNKSFATSVIFPIFKKGDPSEPNNYRGISFMNVIAKILMGVITERLYNWVYKRNILSEYQAGFRKNYSTVDNIYNLTTIVHLKFKEKKKVYAFFVDFKAAFDTVARKSLIFKLHAIGVSTKMVRFIENVYQNTFSTVWNGIELSDKFETISGVKQGCLLSPLLFSLYINDLHEYLEGGLYVKNLNIRLLLYADDIVVMADDVKVLQKMINNLENYCSNWNLQVNLLKSKIMVFRNGGRYASNEKWTYAGNEIEIVNEYNYLGMTITPKCVFTKHVEKKNNAAKNCINMTWSNFLCKNDISFRSKIHLFNAVCRSIQSYGAQIWGHSHFEEIDGLQRFFIKRILKLPKFTPNYALLLESGMEDGHIFTLILHLKYIKRTIFEYSESRLPHRLSIIALENNVSWVKRLNELSFEFNMHWSQNISLNEWNEQQFMLINCLKANYHRGRIRKLNHSESFYKNLDPTVGQVYFQNDNQTNIMWIFKARCDLIELNGSRHSRRSLKKCSLCNTDETENIQHFIGKCPILNSYRQQWFNKVTMSEDEIISILNGEKNWNYLVQYIINALAYRKILIIEYNN